MEYKTQDSIVSFIDILGATNAIKTDAEESLNIVHTVYENSIDLFNELFIDKKISPIVKIFSDNIVVAVTYNEKSFKRSAFFAVAMMSAIIQVEFLKKGWLTRGGIASGDFFSDSLMIWGTALVHAYQLETMIAFYPRIVIEPSLVGELKISLEDRDKHFETWLRQDKDGLFYVEYLNNCLKNIDLFIIRLFDFVENNIVKNLGEEKICQKWIWLSSYIEERLLQLGNRDGE